VSEYGLNPTVLVFVRGNEPSDKVLDLLKALDDYVPKNQKANLRSFAVFLSDDLTDVVKDDEKREDLAKGLLDKTDEFKNLAVALDSYAAIKDLYKLKDDAEVTVLIYHKYKVLGTKTFPKNGLDDKGVQSVLDEVGEKLKAIQGGPKAEAPPK
jgi:hypothetical protein